MEFSAIPASPHTLFISARNCAVRHRVPSVPLALGRRRDSLCLPRADRVSIPSLSPPPASILLWGNHCWRHLRTDGLERDLVFPMPLTRRWKHYLLLFRSVISSNKCLLAKETLIRGQYVLSWVTYHEGAFFTSFYLKWRFSRNCYLVRSAAWISLFFSLLNTNLLLCSQRFAFIWHFSSEAFKLQCVIILLNIR